MISMIDAKEVMETNLASSLGLDKYCFIMNHARNVNVSEDTEFQRAFDGFYIVRRNSEWRKIYFGIFEKMKSKTPEFCNIIEAMYMETGCVEASFSSKMLATINPEKPIWDQYVLRNLGFNLKNNKRDRLQEAVSIYHCIENWYREYMLTENARECIEIFNQYLPRYAMISDIKKIDYLLWGTRG
jgi:hypothetical protein